MLEILNHRMFDALAAPHGLAGASLLAILLLAQGAIYAGPCVVVFLCIFGEADDRRAAVGACLSSLLALAIAHVISSVYIHPRPFMDGPVRNYLGHNPDSSFPSDHSTLLFALGFALWICPPRQGRWFGGLLLVIAVAVGWARIVLGAHYPLDIIGAALVAAISARSFALLAGQALSAHITTFGERLFSWSIAGTQKNIREN
ncbi:undecaprenyl-diphosphatase [Bradyrhizobium sp.]|uniref:undecaprenyl-diphosphatase n=1 Tax=Bradyrhizobium sp. TaxID=376 RepID=UPI0039192457